VHERVYTLELKAAKARSGSQQVWSSSSWVRVDGSGLFSISSARFNREVWEANQYVDSGSASKFKCPPQMQKRNIQSVKKSTNKKFNKLFFRH
jgi:hypothetical protein